MNDIQKRITRYLKQTRVQHWIGFLILFVPTLVFVPNNILTAIPVVLFWIIIIAMIATVIMSWWAEWISDG